MKTKHGAKYGFKKANKSRKHVNKTNTKKMHRNKGQKGGAYDTSECFVFPNAVLFNGNNCMIRFKTFSGGITYYITKNPNLLRRPYYPDNVNQIATNVGAAMNVEKNNILSGVFYLHGLNPTYSHVYYYGLFYLLNRVQLLAVLFRLKSIPKFSSIAVELPITERSTLPGDYNTFPHGYFYQWDDNNHANLVSFIAFSQNIKNIETKLLESFQMPIETMANEQQQIIAGLEIPPPFMTIIRMRDPTIIQMGPDPEEDDDDDDDLRREKKERERLHHENERLAEEEAARSKPRPITAAEASTAIQMMNGLIARYNVGRTQPDQLNQLSTSTLTPANINHAYKRLALHFHPDKTDEDRSRFQELSHNYDILKRMFQNAGKKKKKMHKSR